MISCSLFGFRDALTFKSIDEDIVNQVEQFIANDIATMIERWQTKDPDLIIDKKAFFGVFHEESPRLFKLSIGHRLQIKELVDYVKRIVNSTEPTHGIQYFAPVVIEEKVKRGSQSERYFGFSRQTTSNGTSAALCDSKPTLQLKPMPHDFIREMSQKLFDNLMNECHVEKRCQTKQSTKTSS